MRPMLLVLLAILAAMPALAVDGVLEINQACASQTGCFAGDAAGFPVTISSSGSYRLTSNLDYPSNTGSAIEIAAASDVDIDLNGNTLKGASTCTTGAGGWVTSCSNPFGWPAIGGSGSVRIRVTNGRIIGASGPGIFLADASEVRDVQVSDCANAGIALGSRSIVSSVSSIGNAGAGISIQSSSGLVRDSVVANNRLQGIFVGAGSTVTGNTSFTNGSDGIAALSGSTIQGNTARGNGSFGLNLNSGSSYRDNTITANVGGTVSGAAAVNTGGNACNGTPTCP